MFLTRIGFGSKAVVTGDITQIDLPQGKTSGLREARQVLSGIEGIRFVLLRRARRGPPHARPVDHHRLRSARPRAGGGRRQRERTRPVSGRSLRSPCLPKRPPGAPRSIFSALRTPPGETPTRGAPDAPAALGRGLRPRHDAVVLAGPVVPRLRRPTPGTIATRDVVAPRDLIVPDPDATARRRAEAAAEVLPLYDSDGAGPGPLRAAAAGAVRPRPARRGARRGRAASVTPELRRRLQPADRRRGALGPGAKRVSPPSSKTASVADRPRPVPGRRRGPPRPRPGGPRARARRARHVLGARSPAPRDRGDRVRQRDPLGRGGAPGRGAFAPRERAEVAAFLAAILRPNLTYDAGADRGAARRGVPLGRERLHADPAGQGHRPPGRRDHAAGRPVDRGRAGLGLRPLLVGQGHRAS